MSAESEQTALSAQEGVPLGLCCGAGREQRPGRPGALMGPSASPPWRSAPPCSARQHSGRVWAEESMCTQTG